MHFYTFIYLTIWLLGNLYQTDTFKERRQRMVANQIKARGIYSKDVLHAMSTVPRHLFVPDDMQSRAYQDNALPIGNGQTISQPYIVAFMTDAIKPKSDFRVLEIGTGSGYQAAVLAEIVAEVYTIEIVEELGKRAAETFKNLKYKNIYTKIGDGYAGWEENAPFDAIVVTAAPETVPPPLIEQLKEGGRMIIPVGPQRQVQALTLIEKNGQGRIKESNLLPVVFVPFTGEH